MNLTSTPFICLVGSLICLFVGSLIGTLANISIIHKIKIQDNLGFFKHYCLGLAGAITVMYLVQSIFRIDVESWELYLKWLFCAVIGSCFPIWFLRLGRKKLLEFFGLSDENNRNDEEEESIKPPSSQSLRQGNSEPKKSTNSVVTPSCITNLQKNIIRFICDDPYQWREFEEIYCKFCKECQNKECLNLLLANMRTYKWLRFRDDKWFATFRGKKLVV